jgi:hypothetical protein
MAISLPNAGACGAFLGWDEWMVAGGGMKSLIVKCQEIRDTEKCQEIRDNVMHTPSPWV